MIESIKRRLQKDNNEKESLEYNKVFLIERIIETEKTIETGDKARIILQSVAMEIQSKVENRINKIVQLALNTVFEDPPQFKIEMVQKRGKTEAEITTNGLKPIDSLGGGVVDIIVFGIRMALWSIKPTRKTILLDEPFRNLSRNYQENAAEMVKVISEKLGLQIIMVSHHLIEDKFVDKVIELK